VKPGKLYQPIRVAISGTSVSPGIFESLAVLGKDRSIERIERALERLSAESGSTNGLNNQ
jgi:glutamyl-tRNA synthetase